MLISLPVVWLYETVKIKASSRGYSSYVLIIWPVRWQIVWWFSSDIVVAKDGFTHKCWLFAETMSKWEKLCDCAQTERASGWTNEHVFMCFYLIFLWLMSSLEKKALLNPSTSFVLVAQWTTFRPCICLPNKTNFLLCMGMRLSLPAWAYYYGNKGKHKVGGKDFLETES